MFIEAKQTNKLLSKTGSNQVVLRLEMDKQIVVYPYSGILFKDKKWVIKAQKDMEELKYILLSERSQSEEATYCIIPTMWHYRKGKTMETVKRSVVGEGE